MPYTSEQWIKRVSSRTDMTSYLTHLTRPNETLSSVEVLLKILQEQKIIGSSTQSGFIVGKNRAVCFQDVPFNSLAQNVYLEEKNREQFGGKVRYEAVGLAFRKPYVFRLGARPVIYEQTLIAKDLLSSEDEYWRIVNFNISDGNNIIDWTHEREWRMKGDLEFELHKATVILPSSRSYKNFMEKSSKELLDQIEGIVYMQPILF